jgi:hypothetical protein
VGAARAVDRYPTSKHGEIMRTIAAVSIVALAIGMACEGLAAEPTTRPQLKAYEAPGNLESKYDLGCVGAEKLRNKYTPADLYKAVSKCVESNRYEEGAFLFAVAGAYGRFDSLRVEDKTAHQALTALRMRTLGSHDQPKQAAFKEGVRKAVGTPEGLAAVCKDLVRIGPPDYYPRYMVQHGMGAFRKTGSGDGLVARFDATAAWKQSLDSYLHCPG